MNLREATTKKAMIRQMMNAMKEMMADKTLPKSTMEHMEALEADLKKTWEELKADGTEDPVDQKESGKPTALPFGSARGVSFQPEKTGLSEAMTIGTRLEGQLHTMFTDMVDDLYECGSLTRDEYSTLLETITALTESFYTAICANAPQLYDRSPWMDAPDADEEMPMDAAMHEAGLTKSEDGKDFPAGDYAYVPDAKKPSTWKLRLTATPGGDPDSKIVGDAAAALGKGFRGQKVQIPAGDLAGVKSKVRAAWKKANPDKGADEMPEGIKESNQQSASSPSGAPGASGQQEGTEMFESGMVALVERAVRGDGTVPVKIIQPGWGSSGYYSAAVLQKAAQDVIFGAGTKMYLDHPTMTEEAERPERSIRDLAAELTTNAEWKNDASNGPGLYANAKVFDPFKEAVDELAPHIGVSIRAMGKAQPGQAEGKSGPIIQEISSARSVDFVTSPGAGGKICSILEARRSAAHPDAAVVETAATQEGDEIMGEKELLEANAQLKKQIDEQAGQLARLQEAELLREAGRVASIELGKSDLPIVTRARLVEQLTRNAPIQAGKLDMATFQVAIGEAIKSETAYLVAVTGGGKITGMGGTGEPAEPKPEEVIQSMKESYLSMGYDEKMAEVMAKGR